MPKNTYLERKDRHDRLLGLLRSRSFWTTTDLSVALQVAPRTLIRDLQELRRIGVPIEADRGRGGGLRLGSRSGLGRLDLSQAEALDLLLSLATLEKLKSAMMLKTVKSLRQKLTLCFPESQRRQIADIRRRVLVGDPASKEVLSTYKTPSESVVAVIQEAFFQTRLLKISYFTEPGRKSRRVIEPQYLLLNWPVWYVQGWDHLRSDVRVFRADRISAVSLLKESFPLRGSQIFTEHIKNYFDSV